MHNNETEPTQEVEATPSLSANPEKAMEQMMVIIDDLRTKMIEETAALKEADTASYMSIQDKKIIIARQYLDGMKELLSRKEELRDADPSLKQKLEEARSRFANVAQDNLQALKRMSGGMKRLEERIISAARKEADKENKFAYGSNGYLQNGLASRIGVNESA